MGKGSIIRIFLKMGLKLTPYQKHRISFRFRKIESFFSDLWNIQMIVPPHQNNIYYELEDKEILVNSTWFSKLCKQNTKKYCSEKYIREWDSASC